MKLLLIMSIEEHASEVRKILRDNGVTVYSETDIHGFSTEQHKPDISNWFATETFKRFSKLFFSIQNKEAVATVLNAVKEYNQLNAESKNYPLHAYQLNVEASA